MNSGPHLFRDVVYRSFCRYLRVTPSGFQLPSGDLLQSLPVLLLRFHHARTLYKDKKPSCRSLDGIQSLTEGRSCASCLLRKNCTPQISLEFLHDHMPFRLILSYTSARNFLSFLSTLTNHRQPVENAHVLISVRDRGRWGEICFSLNPPHASSS
jgi:hypothetical protein